MMTYSPVKNQENVIAFQPLQLQIVIHDVLVTRQWVC